MKSPITKVNFRLATEKDKHLPAYDNTKLVAYNTCPTWGVMTYGMNKVMPSNRRNLALEAGSIMHEVFAWVRLCTLRNQFRNRDECPCPAPDLYVFHDERILYDYHGPRLFADRFEHIDREAWRHGEADESDVVQAAKRGAITILETGTFYDDPRDRRRTLANLEECALTYIDRHDWRNKIWIRNESDPRSDIGIEIPFDVVVEVEMAGDYIDGETYGPLRIKSPKQWRYTGKIDGLVHHHSDGLLRLEDNKTASRLGEAWSSQWPMSSQVTGYCLASSLFTGHEVRKVTIHGLCIPLPKTYDYGGIIQEHVEREDYHFEHWVQWFVQTVKGYEQDEGNPYDALRYTHSCSHYFHPCSLIPFCDATRDEQEQIVSEMVEQTWSPLD